MNTLTEAILSICQKFIESPIDFGLLAIAAVALYVTRKQLNQAEETRLTQNKPNVVCYLVLSSQATIELIIENIGNEPAYDVCFQTKLTELDARTNMASFEVLRKGIKFLSVGQSHRLLLGVGTTLIQDEILFQDHEVNIFFEHRDLSVTNQKNSQFATRSFQNHIILDFDVLKGLLEARCIDSQKANNSNKQKEKSKHK